MEEYDGIIQDEINKRIVEKVNTPSNEATKEFYIPHNAAESTKVRIVYDASGRAYEKAPSLNEYLETGPPLQNLLWSVLVRNRVYPVAIAGDLQHAFLQIRIREEDRMR